MKYLILIGDGMSDRPLRELKGRTPLEVARTPNLDFIAKNGTVGWTKNVPRGMPPASDIANMSIFGYDPKKFYTGRGPLEAASLGVKLQKNDLAFRCNLVTVKGRKMKDFTAGHIGTAEARKIIRALDEKLGSRQIRFYAGLSYRHLLVVSSAVVSSTVKCVPPHDITGRAIHAYLPKGKGAEVLLRLMNESEVLLHGMETKATMIWPWGQGKTPSMPAFKKKFGLRGAVITAVHLLKGLGRTLGMEVIDVPGATGYLDTNYLGKAKYAIRALKRNDIVFVHVESPDEAGHEGSIPKKIRAIEDFDRSVVGTILSEIRDSRFEIRILVLPDHPTPIKVMTHTSDPVPFVIYPARPPHTTPHLKGYCEKETKNSKFKFSKGFKLLPFFLKK
ncbi:phosphoglycerate mutase [candidate division WOR-1 bacterium DG_54_3]|uniref:Phosphoglycerate mutase n=1 Tax=candidate division WOR-1 bacterium DG_54_3 TaxID=1703775 RepID=A0A0S7XR22_UNCSA|nr:MAG: phosphoglycerate mutase [candidate division WOR-1 bacterium DG_54_3]